MAPKIAGTSKVEANSVGKSCRLFYPLCLLLKLPASGTSLSQLGHMYD